MDTGKELEMEGKISDDQKEKEQAKLEQDIMKLTEFAALLQTWVNEMYKDRPERIDYI